MTTKYEEMAKDEDMVRRMEDYAVALCNTIDRNTVLFFPSYMMMDRFISDGVTSRILKKIHIEKKGMPQSDLMDAVQEFKESSEKGAVLFAVMGGRISEGIDFPDKELEVAIIAGIPYPRPTARQRAFLHYYEIKFGNGWEYTVKVPATRKLMQAIGRLIRTETDIGIAVIMDKRAQQFSDRLEVEMTDLPVNEVLHFFNQHDTTHIKIIK